MGVSWPCQHTLATPHTKTTLHVRLRDNNERHGARCARLTPLGPWPWPPPRFTSLCQTPRQMSYTSSAGPANGGRKPLGGRHGLTGAAPTETSETCALLTSSHLCSFPPTDSFGKKKTKKWSLSLSLVAAAASSRNLCFSQSVCNTVLSQVAAVTTALLRPTRKTKQVQTAFLGAR